MYTYEFVSKKETAAARKQLNEIIKKVHYELSDTLTFKEEYVGSSSRNLQTVDHRQNKGFDFDINLEIQKNYDDLSPQEIKHLFMDTFNEIIENLQNTNQLYMSFNIVNPPLPIGYYNKRCENSSRVITIKEVVKENSTIIHSVDFCITRKRKDKNNKLMHEFIMFDKANNRYLWNQLPNSNYIYDLIEDIKHYGYWDEVRDLYLDKKNSNNSNNTNKDKKSRSLFIEALHEIRDKYFDY